MKKISILFASAAFALSACDNSTPIDCQIATWNGFRTSAVCFTFDDNCPNQFSVALPLLNEFGFCATLYPILNTVDDYSDLVRAAENGHEVGCHTMSHPNLSQLDIAKVEEQFSQSQQVVSEKLGRQMLTIAYPYCARPSTDDVTEKYFIAGRTCSGRIEKPTPDNYMDISSIGVGSESSTYWCAAAIISTLEEATASGGWVTLLIHEIDNGFGYSPFSSDDLERVAAYLYENDERFWVATFADVVRYSRQRDNTTVDAQLCGDEVIIELTHNLGEVFNLPLTLSLPLPEGWSGAEVMQNGIELDVCLDEEKIVFDAKPNSGKVFVKKH